VKRLVHLTGGNGTDDSASATLTAINFYSVKQIAGLFDRCHDLPARDDIADFLAVAMDRNKIGSDHTRRAWPREIRQPGLCGYPVAFVFLKGIKKTDARHDHGGNVIQAAEAADTTTAEGIRPKSRD